MVASKSYLDCLVTEIQDGCHPKSFKRGREYKIGQNCSRMIILVSFVGFSGMPDIVALSKLIKMFILFTEIQDGRYPWSVKH